ncbi:hypothetical protein F5Y16DRAFT_57942 [Xylariaceae sp. FL0255]|nr:hypothetical protein F5Y16DRAFT_57942 [Xylariaceae sp. FL0255]
MNFHCDDNDLDAAPALETGNQTQSDLLSKKKHSHRRKFKKTKQHRNGQQKKKSNNRKYPKIFHEDGGAPKDALEICLHPRTLEEMDREQRELNADLQRHNKQSLELLFALGVIDDKIRHCRTDCDSRARKKKMVVMINGIPSNAEKIAKEAELQEALVQRDRLYRSIEYTIGQERNILTRLSEGYLEMQCRDRLRNFERHCAQMLRSPLMDGTQQSSPPLRHWHAHAGPQMTHSPSLHKFTIPPPNMSHTPRSSQQAAAQFAEFPNDLQWQSSAHGVSQQMLDGHGPPSQLGFEGSRMYGSPHTVVYLPEDEIVVGDREEPDHHDLNTMQILHPSLEEAGFDIEDVDPTAHIPSRRRRAYALSEHQPCVEHQSNVAPMPGRRWSIPTSRRAWTAEELEDEPKVTQSMEDCDSRRESWQG